MRRLVARAALVAIAGLHCLAGAASAASPVPFAIPRGYRVTVHDRIAPGVGHVRLESARPLHVVEIGYTARRSGYRVDVRHAGPRSAGSDRSLEGTSSLCGRCAYATNGDYAWRQPSRVVGRPIGGIVERGVVLVSPDERHQQASYTVDGGFTTKRLTWSGAVTSSARTVRIAEKNEPRDPGEVVLYTSDYVRSTGTAPGGAEIVLALPGRASNIRPDVPVTATMLALHDGRGDVAVRPGTVVLSGSGAGASSLRRLWASGGRGTRVTLGETLSFGGVWASVGAGHILLRNGHRWLAPESAPHLVTTHPRTFAGVMPDGTLLHVTVDGRERNEGRSVGMPLEEAVAFFLALGAREVVNMDGGGSTTFVKEGRIVNRPSDGSERPVTTAVVVVPGTLPSSVPVVRARRPRAEVPDSPGLVLAVVPAEGGTPLVVWVAIANVAALATILTVMWVRAAPSR